MTTTEIWTVDGVSLSSLAYDITTRDGMDTVPAVVGSNVNYSQYHGERWVRKYFAASRKTLTMWVGARDPITGVPGANLNAKRQLVDTNIDYLTLLFSRRNKLLDVRRTLSSGAVRQASCEVVATIDPITAGLSDAKFAVELYVPGVFWRDVSSSTLASITPGSSQLPAGLQAATAPMVDLEYRITGPITNPRVTDVESGSYFQYNGVVSSGTTLIVTNTTMGITNGTLSNMTHFGEVNWLTMYPSIAGVLVSFTGSSTTGATLLQILGKKAFLR